MSKILISGAGTLASVSYIRHLQANGYYVVGINVLEDTVAKYICDEYHQVPLVNDEDQYIDYIASKIDFDVFLPWLDEEHILFSRRNVPFQQKILTSDSTSILLTTDKISTYHFCIDQHIPVAPVTTSVPAFVRKRFSRGSKFAYIEYIQEKLKQLDLNEYLAQKIIYGTEYTVDILCSNSGDFLFAVPRKRIVAQNVSTISVIDMNPDIIRFCKVVVSKIKFRGPINIQLFDTGHEILLVEINPRLAGTSILSIRGGFDLLIDGIKLFQGLPLSRGYSVVDGLKMYRYYDELYI